MYHADGLKSHGAHGADLKVTKPGNLMLPNFITSKLAAYWADWAMPTRAINL